MLRIGLVSYLIFMGATEQLLCPCSALQFASRFSSPASRETPRGFSLCLCCTRLPTPRRGEPFKGQAPCVPACPCQSRAHHVGLPSSGAHQIRQSAPNVRDGSSVPPFFCWCDAASINVMNTSHVRGNCFFLSPRNRLYVFCLLRC